MVGRTIGKYRIVEQIGRGGMGTVYKAVDETLDRPVAIKMLNADLLEPERVQRFRKEAMTLARLNHPRIATIHELTREGDALMMVMEYVAGETFEKLIARQGALSLQRAIELCDQVLDALEHAHHGDVVHRDLKPANIMVTELGDVKVMDFGIARVVGSEHLTTDGFMVGTPAYMAPEQVRGEEVDRRMDLYSMTVVLYRLLTGHLPFEADTAVGIINKQLNDPPTPPRQFRGDLPDWMEAILKRGLAKKPSERFQSAAEFRQALEMGLEGTQPTVLIPRSDADSETVGPMPTPTGQRVVTATRPPTATPAATPRQPAANDPPTVTLRRNQVAAIGGGVVLLLIAAAIVAVLALRRAASPTSPAASVSPSSASTPVADRSTAVAPAGDSTPAANASPTPVADSAAPVVPAGTAPPAPVADAGAATGKAAPASSGAGSPRSPAAASAKPNAAAGSRTPSLLPTSKSGSTRSAASGATATPAATSTSGASASPPRASVEPAHFGDIKALVPDGSKSKDIDALLSLESDAIFVRSRDNGSLLKTLPYHSIGAATYVDSRKPRWKDDPSLAAVPSGFAGSGFFLKASKHWLTLQSSTDFIILRLDDKNVRQVLASLESRTGLKVLKPESDDKNN